MQSHEKDIMLIDRILSGDQSAYRDLTNRHKDYAFSVAYRIIGSREDAEEVAQDAFIRAFQALSNFNREAKFTTWFYRIVFNAAVGFKRKNRLSTQRVEEVHQESTGGNEASDNIQRHERQEHIRRALQQLSPDDITMITLFYLQEMSLEEIAQVTGTPANTAKVKLHRARKRLAEELNQMLKGEAHSLL